MEEDMEPLVFAIVKKRDEKQLRKDFTDVASYTTTYPYPGVPSTLSILSESEELLPILLQQQVVATLAKYDDYLIQVYATDLQNTLFLKQKKHMRFVFKVPPAAEMEKLTLLTKMMFYFIDVVGGLSLPASLKAKAEKKRAKAAELEYKATHAERQELAQKRKYEKKQKEEAVVQTLTKEQQRKKEERDYKLNLKKRTPKMKVMYG